jgi:amino acid transporter
MTADPYAAPEAAAPPPSPEKLALLDWMGIGIAALPTMRIIAFSLGGWRAMFRDFGALDELPWLTRVVLLPWVPPVLALPAIVALFMVYRTRRRKAQRRQWIVAAMILAFLGIGLCVVAMYLPIFDLAGKIQAE